MARIRGVAGKIQFVPRTARRQEGIGGDDIRCKALEEKNVAFLSLLKPDIERAIERSSELAAALADLPRTYYRIAGLLLLLGPKHAHDSLSMLARAVHCTNPETPDILRQALQAVSELTLLEESRADIESAFRFLAAAFFVKCPKARWPAGITRPAAMPLKARGEVVIVAGGCDTRYDREMRSYTKLLEEAFADFEGTLISGGTKQGISGVVADLAEKSGGRIRAVGYLPRSLPTDGSATVDPRYKLRRTDGGGGFHRTGKAQRIPWYDTANAMKSDSIQQPLRPAPTLQ